MESKPQNPELRNNPVNFHPCIFGAHTNRQYIKSEACYKRTISQRNYRKMTISWSFSYNSFVKFHGKLIWEPQHESFVCLI